MTPKTLYTIGYEGLSLDQFLTVLAANRIGTLIDVRELPLSRKAGFSKRPLSLAALDAGIEYVHFRELGCPKAIRDRYHEDRDWLGYTKRFLTYLNKQQTAVRAIAATARKTTSCLVCFEADFNRCHRTFVARAARALGGPAIMHLGSATTIPDAAQQLSA